MLSNFILGFFLLLLWDTKVGSSCYPVFLSAMAPLFSHFLLGVPVPLTAAAELSACPAPGDQGGHCLLSLLSGLQ